jgi:hypothetical protein
MGPTHAGAGPLFRLLDRLFRYTAGTLSGELGQNPSWTD